MKQIATIAYYELVRLIRYRSVIVMLFLMPLLLILILGSALSTFFVNKPIQAGELRLAVLMEDDGFIRDSLTRFMSGGGMGDTRTLKVSSAEELTEKLANDAADVGIAVPAGFSEGLRKGEKPEWQFFQGSNIVKTVAALQDFHMFFDGWNQRFAESGSWSKGEIPLDTPVPGARVKGELALVQRTGWLESMTTYTAVQYYAAHMLVMFMLYFAMSAAINLVAAKETHTLSRMLSAPVPPWRILTGLLAGQSGVLALQAGIIIGGTAILFGADWGRDLLLLLLTIALFMVFCMSIAVITALLASRKQQVIGIFQTFVIMTTFLSGGFTPAIGEVLSRIGSYTVNYRAVHSILRIMLHDEVSAVWVDIRATAWFAAAAAGAAVLLYRKVGYHE
ncbi:ABC transporter permease [Gorillibacterium sp. sgz5001074]|uniref:ABC transporter permease n=1 Tax=Gorillibacterium sp. sgz5001074 TaxID=3446695 RepID=UPI003F677413